MGTQPDISVRAAELLRAIPYVNIATSTRTGSPWNSPVFAVWTSELVCYWSSWVKAQHSLNIRDNPEVFLTLYDSTRERGTNNLRCLYMQGEAQQVEDSQQISIATKLLYPDEKISAEEAFSGTSVKRIYKAIVRQAWLNAKSEREVHSETVKMRVEVPIAQLKEALAGFSKHQAASSGV